MKGYLLYIWNEVRNVLGRKILRMAISVVCICAVWWGLLPHFDSILQTLIERWIEPLNQCQTIVALYILVRFAQLTAHHDVGIHGINTQIAERMIEMLKPHGRIYITSERPLEPQFEQYRLNLGAPRVNQQRVCNGESGAPEYSLSERGFDTRTRDANTTINPLDMHHVMAFASLYIGDSQTMAAEAGVLGVPFVRFNDFVGRIGYLRELEDTYHLGFGIKASSPDSVDALCARVSELVEMNPAERHATFQSRRATMLSEKIDCAKFLTYFIEGYPDTVEEVRGADKRFWKRFK